MSRFRFCPHCASALREAAPDGGSRCPSCGRSWYDNPAPTAGCAIVQDGRAMITMRARPPEEGRFDVPGGFLQAGEHPLDGLKREVREELGVEVEVAVDDCLSMAPHRYGEDGPWLLSLGFKARLKSGEPAARDDVAQLRWVSEGELDEVDFAWAHDRELVRKALHLEGDG
jgi:ADP-ribose pyrophosphatase YjhB (NUDIX family)